MLATSRMFAGGARWLKQGVESLSVSESIDKCLAPFQHWRKRAQLAVSGASMDMIAPAALQMSTPSTPK